MDSPAATSLLASSELLASRLCDSLPHIRHPVAVACLSEPRRSEPFEEPLVDRFERRALRPHPRFGFTSSTVRFVTRSRGQQPALARTNSKASFASPSSMAGVVREPFHLTAVPVELDPLGAALWPSPLPMPRMPLIPQSSKIVVAYVVAHVRRSAYGYDSGLSLWAASIIVLVEVDRTLARRTVAVIGVAAAAVVDHVVAKIVGGILAVRCHARDATCLMSPEIVVHRNSAIVSPRRKSFHSYAHLCCAPDRPTPRSYTTAQSRHERGTDR